VDGDAGQHFRESHEIFNTPKLAREILFLLPHTRTLVESGAMRVAPDSMRAVFLGQVFRLPKRRRITTPLLVLDVKTMA
jgi:hypothetical protein